MNKIDNPSEKVLDTYLLDCMEDPAKNRVAYELEADLLYLLTDDTHTHRRAMRESALAREIVALRALEPDAQSVTPEQIEDRLRGLIARRVVCKAETEAGENEYELAHDFLVRAVVKVWNQVDRERTERAALSRRRQTEIHDKYARFDQISRICLRVLPPLVIGLMIWFAASGFWGSPRLPAGLSSLWLVVCPACVLAVIGAARKSAATVLFAAVGLIACAIIANRDHRPLTPKELRFQGNFYTRYSLNSQPRSSYIVQSRTDLSLNYSWDDRREPSGTFDLLLQPAPLLWRNPDVFHSYDYAISEPGEGHVGTHALQIPAPLEWQPPTRISPPSAWLTVLSFCLLLMLIPQISLQAFARFEASSRARLAIRIWTAELIDIVIYVLLGGLIVYGMSSLNWQGHGARDFWSVINGSASWRQVLPDFGDVFWQSAIIGVLLTTMIFTVFVVIRKRTPGGYFMKLNLTRKDDPAPWSRILFRQFFFIFWSVANLFWLAPALLLTPMLALRKEPQTICDLLTGLTESDSKAANAKTVPAARPDRLAPESIVAS
jgi:hypothetical protein